MNSSGIGSQVAALKLTIECLPRLSLWQSAIRARRDGTSPERVFSVVDNIRMRLYASLGQAAPAAGGFGESFTHDLDHQRLCASAGAANVDVAYQLVLDSLPRRETWGSVFGQRRGDPSSLRDVFPTVNLLRMRLHALYGDWRASCKGA